MMTFFISTILSGAISVTVPLAGDADAQIALPEDTTGALTIETVSMETSI